MNLSSVLDFGSFHLAFTTTLDRFAPVKQKVVRNSNQPFMTKTLRKAIMKKSKLKQEDAIELQNSASVSLY